jgi:putative ABC transport system ATP-binding protein
LSTEGLLQSQPEIHNQAPSGAGPTILVEQVHKTYDLGEVQVHALRGVTLTVYPGEFVAIMGASGSGKSTFMNIVGCLDRPTRGRYLLDGQEVATFTKRELAGIRNRKIGFVFQGFNLLSRTSAVENVELPLIYSGVPREQRVQRAREALKSVGLEGREEHHPSQLSGGQQQRVAIARSLVNNPSIILADEPTGNLDSRTSVEIMEIFQRLNEDRRMTVLLVTHETDIAKFAKRVVLFKDGKIRRDSLVEARVSAARLLPTMPSIDADEEDEGSPS